jgi:hypothetical protein
VIAEDPGTENIPESTAIVVKIDHKWSALEEIEDITLTISTT